MVSNMILSLPGKIRPLHWTWGADQRQTETLATCSTGSREAGGRASRKCGILMRGDWGLQRHRVIVIGLVGQPLAAGSAHVFASQLKCNE